MIGGNIGIAFFAWFIPTLQLSLDGVAESAAWELSTEVPR